MTPILFGLILIVLTAAFIVSHLFSDSNYIQVPMRLLIIGTIGYWLILGIVMLVLWICNSIFIQ